MTTTTGEKLHSTQAGPAKGGNQGKTRRRKASLPAHMRAPMAMVMRLRPRINEGDAAAMREGLDLLRGWTIGAAEHDLCDEQINRLGDHRSTGRPLAKPGKSVDPVDPASSELERERISISISMVYLAPGWVQWVGSTRLERWTHGPRQGKGAPRAEGAGRWT